MTPSILRELWATVESTQSSILLQLDDHSLVDVLVDALTESHPLTSDEASSLQDYVRSKITLIRDLANSRYAA
ncbi:MAG: hypothetical protein AAF889_05650 [Cyanobacteria bacterium P01_D01_bin.73]